MGTGRMLMDACFLVNSMLFTVVQEYDSLVKRVYLLFVQYCHIHAVLYILKLSITYIRVIFDFEIGFARHKQIIYRFIIDLHIGNPYIVIVIISVLKEISQINCFLHS